LKCDGTRAETGFRLSAQGTSPFKSAGESVQSTTASCAHQPAWFALLAQACVLQSCDACWLTTPFASFPFTSSPVRHRVPSHFRRSLHSDGYVEEGFIPRPQYTVELALETWGASSLRASVVTVL